jgi:hypothetical protein
MPGRIACSVSRERSEPLSRQSQKVRFVQSHQVEEHINRQAQEEEPSDTKRKYKSAKSVKILTCGGLGGASLNH